MTTEMHPDAAPVICPVCLRERLDGDIHGEGRCVREITVGRATLLEEQIDRVDKAVESLAWFLVANQSLSEADARAIEGILNGTAPPVATARNTVTDPEKAPANPPVEGSPIATLADAVNQLAMQVEVLTYVTGLDGHGIRQECVRIRTYMTGLIPE